MCQILVLSVSIFLIEFIIPTVNAWNELVATDPSLAVASDGSKLGPGKEEPVERTYEVDSQKSKDVLGMTYRDVKSTLVDTVLDFKAKGWM